MRGGIGGLSFRGGARVQHDCLTAWGNYCSLLFHAEATLFAIATSVEVASPTHGVCPLHARVCVASAGGAAGFVDSPA
eukprot:11187032-Lingulodinium_polyedra.AAC.1